MDFRFRGGRTTGRPWRCWYPAGEDHPGSVVTWLYGVTPQALGRVARLLFFYGWQSYVVFQEGAVTARGDWEDRMSTEVRFEAE